MCFPFSQYHTVAAAQSTQYPTPLSQAECVSLVMAYELIRTCQLEGGNAMLLDWISLQGESEDSNSICKFAVSSNKFFLFSVIRSRTNIILLLYIYIYIYII